MSAESQPSMAVPRPSVYRFTVWTIGLLAILAALIYIAFEQAIVFMVGQWALDELSHGYLIPFVSAFLVWQRRDTLRRLEFSGSWTGVALLLFGVVLDITGRLSALYTLQHVALLIVIAGVALALTGWPGMRILGPPLGVLVFMIPLPNILLQTLSAQLQLISSSVGVAMMRLFGVPVFLAGNVIDLGSYRLEVAEACSGLRYLLPLMTLAFLMACFYRTALWKRIVVFLSSIPITLLMNSLRIASIGVMVDRWGIGVAEGLVHQVQGWMMFMLSAAMLMLEIVLLSRMGGDRRPWREAFNMESPKTSDARAVARSRRLPLPIYASIAVMTVFAIAAWSMPQRAAVVPERQTFATFPLRLGDWSGTRQAMDREYLDALKLTDYLMADYARRGDSPVNLYVAWYDAQSAGEATHSPKACLPGGGWQILDLQRSSIDHVKIGAQPLQVNRALIQFGDQRQLVYYWFQQRGRVVTNEYLVKWYLLLDALTRHRTDGALVRLIVPISRGMTDAQADHELRQFASVIAPRLDHYIPS